MEANGIEDKRLQPDRSVLFMFRPKFWLLLSQVGLDPQGTSYNGVYGGLRPKGLAYQASGIWKGRDFTSWDKWVAKSVMSVCKGPKGLTGAYYDCEKCEKKFWFSDLLIFKRRNLTAVKSDAKSKLVNSLS